MPRKEITMNNEVRTKFINKIASFKNLDEKAFKTAVTNAMAEMGILPDPKKPIEKPYTYIKFGFVKTRATLYRCPTCNNSLNAGPNFQPKCCSACGQPIDFSDTKWKKEEFVEYVSTPNAVNE